MSALRVGALTGALALNALLALAPPRPALAWLHPVAPPLTHIPEMGEAVLAGGEASAAPPSGAPAAPPSATPGAPPTATPGAPPSRAPGAPLSGTPGAPPSATPGAPPSANPGGPPGPTAHRPHPGGMRGPPPLRGLAGAVESVVRAVGTPDQQEALAELRGVDQQVLPHARRSMELRLAVQADAVALAEALGPERVGVIVARKDDLSTRVGEGRAWAAAIERVAR